ncbi:MAG: glycosyltransferase family 2 protein [Chloroflexi bacterium]|nr:glycosyltransferase family 2 protein [Chloroflexota bacterium]
MRLAVIIPVYNGREYLVHCLAAIKRSSRMPDELLVVDDGSTDGSGTLAAEMGACALRLGERPQGPAVARNRAATICQADILVFVDADVALHSDALSRMEAYLEAHPEVSALFGSYDDAPTAPGLVSRYKNLFHHYTHQHSRREASTFWAGCGAIRREAFWAAGGFPEEYPQPSIEDIALGMRLRRQGHRIWLCPEIQGTHLKRWTFGNMLKTDIFQRAIPWGNLMLREGYLPNDLNLDWRNRLGGALAILALLGLLGTPFRPWIGGVTAAALLGLVWLNADLYRFFFRHGGWRFALGAAGLHLLYLLYSSVAFGYCFLRHIGSRLRAKQSAEPL